MSGEVWTTKDGKKIAVVDMEDGHLENALQMCRRNHEAYMANASAAAAYPGNPDSMGSYYADQAMNEGFDSADFSYAWVKVFEKEQERRRG
jgi:hypothetical protein